MPTCPSCGRGVAEGFAFCPGAAAAHEDDALRACRAAVEIREAVADLGKELEQDLGAGFRVRVGVSTGSSPWSDIPLAMRGRFDEARRANEERRAPFEELGRPQWLTDFGRGTVELIAGDAREAGRFLRRGRDELLRIGEKSVLSTLSALLSRALCLQGRFDEALPFIEETVGLAPSEVAASQMCWRTSKAMVQASRGDLGEAERLAREAVAIGRTTDAINDLADALADLAGIVAARGRGGEVADLLREAVELFERKGSVVSAGRARQRLAELGGGSVGP